MSPRPVAGRIGVSADLRVSITAPDGSTARLHVRDEGDELVVDVDRPLIALRSLPRDPGVFGLRHRAVAARASVGHAPAVRVRTRQVTLAVVRDGSVRPGAVVAAAIGVSIVVVAAAGVAVARRILAQA